MTTLKTIKEEPELSIIDDPYVSKLCLWQIDSVHTSIERIEETIQDSAMERIMKATVSGEKEKLNVNVHSTTKRHRKDRRRKTDSGRKGGFINNCPVCGKTFEKLTDYELHMPQVHNIKPFECSTCGRKFSRKAYLAPHMRVHSGEKPYPCKLCAASFSRASDFKKHNRSHQGIKLFKCELCDKRFTRAFSLRYHLSSHMGEKSYVCEICGLRFRYSRLYSYHKKTLCKNTFECVYCKKEFQGRDSMVYHLRTKH